MSTQRAEPRPAPRKEKSSLLRSKRVHSEGSGHRGGQTNSLENDQPQTGLLEASTCKRNTPAERDSEARVSHKFVGNESLWQCAANKKPAKQDGERGIWSCLFVQPLKRMGGIDGGRVPNEASIESRKRLGDASMNSRTCTAYMASAHMTAVTASCIPSCTLTRKPCQTAASHAATVAPCEKSSACALKGTFSGWSWSLSGWPWMRRVADRVQR